MSPAVALALLAACLAGCGSDGGAPGSTTVITGTPQAVAAGSLRVTLGGPSQRSFIVPGGRWRVCDQGTVTNPTGAIARDVRVVVVYVDHGLTVGSLGPDQPAEAGGRLGDLLPGQSRPFSVCGLATEEPDSDRVSAVVGP